MIEIQRARLICANDSSITPECNCLCALENSNMLTPAGDAINPDKIGKVYTKYAASCFNLTAKPSCDEAEQFVNCFLNSARKESPQECSKQFKVSDLKSITMSDDGMVTNENEACFASCIADKVYAFNDDDTIDLAFANPHLDFKFNTRDVASKCEETYKQRGSKCQIQASIFICLLTAFEKVQSEYFIKMEKMHNNP